MILARGNWFFILLSVLSSLFMTRPYLYTIQQDNYRVSTILHSKRLRTAYLIDLLSVGIFVGIFIGVNFLQSRIFWGFLDVMFFFIAEITLYFAEEMPEKKKPMRYTKRAVRGLVAVVIVNTALIMMCMFHLNKVVDDAYFRYSSMFAFPIFYPLIFATTMFIINIFERLNNFRYTQRTRRKLNDMPSLIKIGITGSFGKTSVKNCLDAILSEKYKVLSSPESYNTPMGIAKTVNMLDNSYDVLIAEMGARRVGDIKKLMKIVSPNIGVLTGINSQHLETFKSQENIIKEKTKVISMLEDGVGFASDSVVDVFLNAKHPSKLPYFVGFSSQDYVYASDIALTSTGSVFNLHFGDEIVVCETALLGVHNIQNIALASAVAYYLGVETEQIVSGIAKIKPIPHRLQLICANGIKIIDDTFNSNPDGAKSAIDVLSSFGGRKIVLTPGLVELGKREDEENRNLGQLVASVADVVILIGENAKDSLLRGLKDVQFNGMIYEFDTLASAQASFKDILHIGDNLLLLNDLPDIYD